MATDRRRRRGPRLVLFGPLLLLGLALALPLGATPVGNSAPALGARLLGSTGIPSTLALAIAPATWWMVGGTDLSLSAGWTGIPPGCALAPAWYRWSIAPGVADGVLSASNGSGTNFSASENASGTTGVMVQAAATLTCAAAETAAVRGAEANVTVDAPPSVGNLSLEPDPADPGVPVFLNGTIVGGEPPYALSVAWGNGTVSHAVESSPGAFAMARVLGPGTFAPQVFVVDREGLFANATVHESVTVGEGFAVGLLPTTWEAEVGARVEFALSAANAPPTYSLSETCESVEAAEAPMAGASALPLSCRFAVAGPALVTAVAVDAAFPFTVASATLLEPVAPTLSVALPGGPVPGEVGVTSYLPVSIRGGVPPFALRWSLVGGGAPQLARVASDGSALLPVTPTTAGADVLTVESTDALGIVAANSTEGVDAAPRLVANVTAASEVGPAGVAVNLSGSVASGAAPFLWVVAPARTTPNGSTFSGLLSTPGAFAWNGSFRAEGALAISVAVIDRLGSVWSNTTVAPLVPPLVLAATWGPPAAGELPIVAEVAGGVAPFALWVNGTGGVAWNVTVPADGAVYADASIAAVGSGPVVVTVVDDWGVRDSVEGAPITTGPPRSLDPASIAPIAAEVGLGVAGVGAIAAFWRRRRPGVGREDVDPDPEPVLREIIAPADGADRATVELLAEEQGISLERIRETLDRLIEDGTVRSERGADGEEVLAWTPLR